MGKRYPGARTARDRSAARVRRELAIVTGGPVKILREPSDADSIIARLTAPRCPCCNLAFCPDGCHRAHGHRAPARLGYCTRCWS